MSSAAARLPGFRACCSVVGALYVLLASSMLARGAPVAMRPFGVPEEILRSPHYADYFHFTFVHMATLGVLIALLGRYVADGRPQQLVSRVLVLVQFHYAYLDFRTSDSVLGNRLYDGPATLIPPVIDLAVALCFAWLGARPLRYDGSVPTMRA